MAAYHEYAGRQSNLLWKRQRQYLWHQLEEVITRGIKRREAKNTEKKVQIDYAHNDTKRNILGVYDSTRGRPQKPGVPAT